MLPIIPKTKLFLSTKKVDGIFGGGKWNLLNAIKEEGSLQKASKKLGRGYRKAWGDIKIAEEGFGQVLIIRERGGVKGGKSVLTEFAKKLLKSWDKYNSELMLASEKSFKKNIQPIITKGL